MTQGQGQAPGSDRAAACVLAFDFGLSNIGIAVGQTITGTASPLTTMRARNGVPDWTAIEELVSQWQPIRLAVGLPLNMDDSESDMSRRARRFADRLSARTGVPATMVDERLTSAVTRDAADSHAAAATLIAESWLAGSSG